MVMEIFFLRGFPKIESDNYDFFGETGHQLMHYTG